MTSLPPLLLLPPLLSVASCLLLFFSASFSRIFRATAAAVCRHLVKGDTTSLVTPREAAKSPRDEGLIKRCWFFSSEVRVSKSRGRGVGNGMKLLSPPSFLPLQITCSLPRFQTAAGPRQSS